MVACFKNKTKKKKKKKTSFRKNILLIWMKSRFTQNSSKIQETRKKITYSYQTKNFYPQLPSTLVLETKSRRKEHLLNSQKPHQLKKNTINLLLVQCLLSSYWTTQTSTIQGHYTLNWPRKLTPTSFGNNFFSTSSSPCLWRKVPRRFYIKL